MAAALVSAFVWHANPAAAQTNANPAAAQTNANPAATQTNAHPAAAQTNANPAAAQTNANPAATQTNANPAAAQTNANPAAAQTNANPAAAQTNANPAAAQTNGAFGTSIGAAQIAAMAAIVSALIALSSAIFNEARRRANDRTADFKLRGDLQLSALEARREYEYEARKRLYRDCEPVLFQLSQSCRVAIGRILSLARLARESTLEEDGMLSGDLDSPGGRGYYIRSTLYQLLAPLANYYILQERLTSTDITLDRWIRRQYYLSEAAYKAYTRDFRFAEQHPVVDGYRETVDRDKVTNYAGQIHQKQGVYLGQLDIAVYNMVERRPGASRVVTFGKFEQLLLTNGSELADSMRPLVQLFSAFHPSKRPVTWRILIAQYYLFRAIRLNQRRSLEQRDEHDVSMTIKLEPENEHDLWWKPAPNLNKVDDEFVTTLAIGHAYMTHALGVRSRPTLP